MVLVRGKTYLNLIFIITDVATARRLLGRFNRVTMIKEGPELLGNGLPAEEGIFPKCLSLQETVAVLLLQSTIEVRVWLHQWSEVNGNDARPNLAFL